MDAVYRGILVLALCGIGGAEIDLCLSDIPNIPNIGQRYINYRISATDVWFNDYRLTTGWYRVGDDPMPESVPDDIFTCGTKYPIWLNGEHPTGHDIVDRTACKYTLFEDCGETYNIRIKKCNTSFIYHLGPTSYSDTAYCFGEGTPGQRTTIKINKPIVEPYLKRTTFRNRDVYTLHFRCNFLPSSTGPAPTQTTTTEELYYLVSWYGNDKKLYNTPLSNQTDDEILQLNEDTFVEYGFQMGQHISCSAVAFSVPQGPPGEVSELADNYFVGIEILTPSLTFASDEQDEEKRKIRMRPTVPIGCIGQWPCYVQLFTYTANNTERVCEKIGVEHSACGVQINSSSYNKTLEMLIRTVDDNTYLQEEWQYDIFLQISDRQYNKMWKAYKLPRIPVNLKPPTHRTFEGKKCFSRNDPHIKTFDGRSYDNHQSGVYTMYQHLVYDAEIQMKYSNCGSRRVGSTNKPVKCNCGFAARIGVSLYVIDVCDETLSFSYKFCGDEALVVQNKGEKKFTLTFIYGTYAEVTVYWSRFLTVEIYPSSNDVNATRGLCGILDSDCTNDFHYKDGEGPANDPALENGPCNGFTNWHHVFVNQPLTFINSWRVKNETKNLFGSNITVGDLQPFDKYKSCVCLKELNPGGPLEDEIFCVKDSVAKCSGGSDIIGKHSCAPATRTRRSVHNAPILPEVRIDNHVDRWKREVTEEKNWTESEAGAFCQEFMDRSAVFRLCSEVPNVQPEISVETCIMDLMMTGDTTWADVALEDMQNGCLEEVKRNSTLRKKTSNSEMSLAEEIEEKACPNNCSGVGTCDKGACSCSSDWAGSDCSIDLTVAPSIQGLLEQVCDKQGPACDYAYVFGQIFAKSTDLTCKVEEFALSEDGTRLPRASHTYPGQFETMIEVICPLQSTRRKRAVSEDEFVLGFTVSVSNNGQLYEAGKDLFIYDSECQNVQNINNQMHFTLKEGYCFIENRCVYNGDRSPSTNCSFCNPTESTRTWSTDTQISGCVPQTVTSPTESDDMEKQYIYLIAIAGIVGGLLVLTVAVLVIRRIIMKRPKRVGDSSISLGEGTVTTPSKTKYSSN